MKNNFAKFGLFISFILIGCLCLTMLSFAGWVNVCPEDGVGGLYQLTTNDDSFAVQFNATKDFTCIGINIAQCNSPEGTVIFELFPWNNSYAETIDKTKNPPLASKTFVNFTEGRVWFDGFNAPAGEYVVYVTTPNSNEGIAFWTRTNATEGIIRLYGKDVERKGEAPDVFVLTYPIEPDVANGEKISGPLSPVEAPVVTPTPQPTVPPTNTGDIDSNSWNILLLVTAIIFLVLCSIQLKRKVS